jgi:hypothetical protein
MFGHNTTLVIIPLVQSFDNHLKICVYFYIYFEIDFDYIIKLLITLKFILILIVDKHLKIQK